jgi:eukaryotic-like serine/threonine-protein kinase
MAPEQRRGAPEDERTDVFALGVLIHQMVAGALPFGDAADAEMDHAPALHVPGAPGLQELVQRMLQVDPIARPRDAGKVLAELRGIARRAGAATSDSQGASRGAQRATGGARRPPLPRTGR